MLVLAGGWGILAAKLDHRLLFGIQTGALPAVSAASLLSQYRFLRAIELGFGSFAFVFRREIFTQGVFNRVFLLTMSLGVVARVVSLVTDGRPRGVFYVFLLSEAVGVVLIFLSTRAPVRLA
jgi:hypothetical protein